MKLFGWISGVKKQDGRTAAIAEWRQKWMEALESDGSPSPLREQLDALTTPDLDVEVEIEMLDGLEQLREAQRTVAAGTLPVVETHHRVIGADRCHFTAPASLPSDQHRPMDGCCSRPPGRSSSAAGVPPRHPGMPSTRSFESNGT